jgi:hypothetical protein
VMLEHYLQVILLDTATGSRTSTGAAQSRGRPDHSASLRHQLPGWP